MYLIRDFRLLLAMALLLADVFAAQQVSAAIVDEIRPSAECRGHVGAVNAVLFRPDGQQIISAGADKSVRRWSLDGREQLPAFIEHTDAVSAIAIGRDGKRIASGGHESKIRVWDAASGKQEYLIDAEAKVLSLALVQNGQIVAAGCGNSRFRNWRLNGQAAEPGSWNMHGGNVNSMAVCPDDRTACTCWNAPSVTIKDLAGVSNTSRGSSTGKKAMRCSVSGDGRAVLVIDEGGMIRVLNWDRFDAIRVRTVPLANRLFGQLSSRANFAVLASKAPGTDAVVSVWDLANDRIVANLFGGPAGMTDLAISSDDTHVAISGDDGRVVIWNLERLLPELKASDITPLLSSIEKLNEVAKDVIKMPYTWALVPLTISKVPYLQNAGAYVSPGTPDSLGATVTTKRDMPLYLIVDWTYKGPPAKQEEGLREYRKQLMSYRWIELQPCPWNPDASIFMHANTAAGDKDVPFIGQLFSVVPQVVFSTDFTDASATDREKFGASVQQRMMYFDVRRMLEKKDWNGLEEQAKKLRREKKSFANGVSELWTFYEGASGHSSTKTREGLLNEWIKAKPKSAAAKLSLAITQIRAGWSARGGDIAERVTQDGAKELAKLMKSAQKLAQDAGKNESNDPMVEWCLLECMRALGDDAKNFKQVAIKGLKKDPWFMPITESIAFSLLPRWYGDERDVEDFALKVRDEIKGDVGLAHYALVARLVMSFERGGWDTTFHFSSELIQRGLTIYQEKFPESTFAKNLACWMACHEGRLDDARKLFSEIGLDCDQHFWRSIPVFDEFRETVRPVKPDRLQYRILAHDYLGVGMAISHDGKVVATCGRDPEICLFDIATGTLLETGKLSIEAFEDVAFVSDDALVARKATDIVHWQLKEETAQRFKWNTPSVDDVFEMSPDGAIMVAAPNEGKIQLHAFDTETGKSKFQIPASSPLKAAFRSLSFSPDGKQLIYSDTSKSLTLFDMNKGKVQCTLEVDQGRILAAASFDDARKVGAVLDRRMVEWDVASRKITWSQETNEGFGNRLAISPDGRWWANSVFQAGEPLAGRTVLWDRKLNDGWQRLPEIRSRTNQLQFTNDSKKLITLSASGFLRIWKLDD